ncbi:MAG TPA: hypothetical protein PKA66_00935 [Gemmatimonadales bacterium]|nr:hypothetical protein [Gemmatimonadales bacterium]
MRHAFAFFALLVAAQPVHAQVGYPPSQSPYRDITKRTSLTALFGYIGGSGGKLGLGPHDGPAYGGRFGFSVSGPLELSFAVQYADLVGARVFRDQDNKLTVSGTLPSPVWMFETDVQYTFTGGKTWHGLAPYIGGGLGYAWRSSSTEGPDAYDFGGRFYWAPFAGTRFFVNQRSFLRAEIRGAFWRLAYPPPYYDDITGIIQSYAINNYLSNVWYQVGFGYSF